LKVACDEDLIPKLKVKNRISLNSLKKAIRIADEEYLKAEWMMHPGVSEAKNFKKLFSLKPNSAS
jgi:hypothetical protein